MEQIILTPQDLTHLNWSKISNSSGTAGSFLKSQEDTPEGRIYYKLSDYNAYDGVIGHESVNEILMRRDKLHPLRTDAKYKLFSKAEVMQRRKS